MEVAMKTELLRWLLAVILAVLVNSACAESPHDSDCCVQWAVTVTSDVPSGVEIRLDGNLVYRATSSVLKHYVDLVRQADTVSHLVEVTVLAEQTEPATFAVGAVVQRRPGGDFESVLGQPKSLHVGDQLTLTVQQ
jgi:hypothetical protein